MSREFKEIWGFTVFCLFLGFLNMVFNNKDLSVSYYIIILYCVLLIKPLVFTLKEKGIVASLHSLSFCYIVTVFVTLTILTARTIVIEQSQREAARNEFEAKLRAVADRNPRQ